MSDLGVDAIIKAPIMRASSGPQGQVFKPLIQVSDERRKAPEKRADIDLLAFIEINAAEVVDAAKKGLIIRASLLESPEYRKIKGAAKRPEKATITGRSPMKRSFTID
jgi:hypothetical protein